MRSSFLALSSFALASIAALLGCSSSEDVRISGTATDTENTVASVKGVVTRTDGKISANASVRMARVSKDAATLAALSFVEIQTDTAGLFSFDSVLADTFQLAVIDTVAGEVYYLSKTTAESKKLDSIKLVKAVTISSKLLYQDSEISGVSVGSHFKAYLPGTPFSRSVFAGDSFSMLIPAGEVRLAFCPADQQIISKLVEYGVADSLIYRSWEMESGSLEAGDSLSVGPLIWSMSPDVAMDSIIKDREATGRISGVVKCKNGKPCAGVEVQMVTDLYGFNFKEGDSLVFKSETQTDSLGRWFLRVPNEVPYDSFRVEFRRVVDNAVSEAGVTEYVRAKSVDGLMDTLELKQVTLRKPSKMVSSVRVVLDSTNTDLSDNCMMNSVVIGIKGTTHFVRDVTCNLITMSDLPDGDQDLVLYTGDPKVLSTLQNMETLMDYVSQVDVNLPEGRYLDQQGMTYNPPVIK